MKATNEDQNAVGGAFLDFLARDISEHPERLRGVSPKLAERIRALTADASVDLDAPVHGATSL